MPCGDVLVLFEWTWHAIGRVIRRWTQRDDRVRPDALERTGAKALRGLSAGSLERAEKRLNDWPILGTLLLLLGLITFLAISLAG